MQTVCYAAVVLERVACLTAWHPLQVPTDTSTINMSHVIHHMAFGPQYRGQINPLDGKHCTLCCIRTAAEGWQKLLLSISLQQAAANLPLAVSSIEVSLQQGCFLDVCLMSCLHKCNGGAEHVDAVCSV